MTLPNPDQFRNYWLGRDRHDGPALFAAKRREEDGKVAFLGWWYVFYGRKRGFAWDGPRLRAFESPEEAAEWMETHK